VSKGVLLGFWLPAGMRDWRLLFPWWLPCPWRAAGRVKDRAEPGRQGRRRRRP
jgi:hypothetical protein